MAEAPTAATTLPRNLYDSRAIKWKTDPLLPALVERLGLVHAIPVAAKVATVSVVEVTVLVAKVATVTTSLIVLQWDRDDVDQQGAGPDFRLTGCFQPTWPGCPLCPPRFIWPPPPLFMFPRCPGPPLFMCPPRGPMLPLMGPPLGDPPRMGMWPRLKFPRPGKPPLMFSGGRKLRGGREKPQCGPGPAEHHPLKVFLCFAQSEMKSDTNAPPL